jgi:molybdopterin synthase sulfur carrier subunit
MIRVVLPSHLRKHAEINGEVTVELGETPATQRTLLDALERTYPVLRGTIRDHGTQKRRAFLRFFACQRDISHEPPDAPLPDEVVNGAQPFMIVGAIAGG